MKKIVFLFCAALILLTPLPSFSDSLFEEIKASWVWALREGNYYERGPRLTAEEFSSQECWENLKVAVAADGVASIRYAGMKKATERREEGAYLSFENISGPVWEIENDPHSIKGAILLLPASVQDSLLKITSFEYKEVSAAPEEIARMEELKGGRKVLNSELLATDSSGGRVVLFRYVNTDEGLVILAYIRGEKIITREFPAQHMDDNGEATWRADLDDDEYGSFQVVMLCETEQRLVIAFTWGAPEGINKYLLVEQDGQFVELPGESWSFDFREDKFYTDSYDKSVAFAADDTDDADNYVRLSIKGKNVNLRPQAQAVGRVIAQVNTGDVFIAGKQLVVNEPNGSKWYEIVLAVDAKTNKITALSNWNSRFKANSAFVHADFVAMSPLAGGDMDDITTALDAGHTPDIYGKWLYTRTTNGPDETPYYIAELEIALPSLEIGRDNKMVSVFYESHSEGTLVQTDANSYTYTDVFSEAEGEKSHQDSGG